MELDPRLQREIPPSVWSGDKKSVPWSLVAVVPGRPVIFYSGMWKSPLFDLRPDLRSETATTKIGTPIYTRAGRLYVQFFGLEGTNNENLQMFATEFANVNIGEAPGAPGGPVSIVPPISAPIDISAVYGFVAATAPGSAMLGYSPFSASLGGGDGYPVRYWYLQLNFVKKFDVGLPNPDPLPLPPNIIIQAGFY